MKLASLLHQKPPKADSGSNPATGNSGSIKQQQTPFLKTAQGRIAMGGIAAFIALLLYNHFMIEQPQTAIHQTSGQKGKAQAKDVANKK